MLTPATRPNYTSLLQAHALSEPSDAPALIFVASDAPPRPLSRAEFAAHTAHSAAEFAARGLKAGDFIGLAAEQSLEAMVAFWGALCLGAIPSFYPPLTEKLDPRRYAESMAQVVAFAGLRLLLTSADFAPILHEMVGAACAVDVLRPLPSAPLPAPSFPVHQGVDGLAFLQHSSGTTGLQKGVMLSHEAVLNQLAHLSAALDLRRDDVIVSWLPLYHDMGLIAAFILPLMQGLPLVLMSPFDWVAHPALLLKSLHDYGGTLCWLPNFAYHHCARRIRKRDSQNLDLSRVRAFINCSEPVHAEAHAQFLARFAENGLRPEQLQVSYAMAENTFAVTQTRLGTAPRLDPVSRAALEGEKRATPCPPGDPRAQIMVSCGATLANTQVKIVDEQGRDLPERHVGEIAITSDCMLTGYHRREDLNAALWREGWYLSGDMGYIAEGELYVVGRKKDLIITAGKNVYPQDLEAIVSQIEGVHPGRVAAFGVYDEREGTELIGIVAEVESEDPAERARISAAIRAALVAQTTVSATYVHLVGPKWLIKTSSGKVARTANRDKWLAEQGEKPS